MSTFTTIFILLFVICIDDLSSMSDIFNFLDLYGTTLLSVII